MAHSLILLIHMTMGQFLHIFPSLTQDGKVRRLILGLNRRLDRRFLRY